MKCKNSTRRRRQLMTGLDQAGGHSSAANRVVVPCRLYSWLNPVSALPLGSFNQPWARSRAWISGIDRQHHRILGRLKIESHDVGRFLGEGPIGADAP